jgi:hypothetical protein
MLHASSVPARDRTRGEWGVVTKGEVGSASKEENEGEHQEYDLERDGRSLPCRRRFKLGAQTGSNALVLGLVSISWIRSWTSTEFQPTFTDSPETSKGGTTP